MSRKKVSLWEVLLVVLILMPFLLRFLVSKGVFSIQFWNKNLLENRSNKYNFQKISWDLYIWPYNDIDWYLFYLYASPTLKLQLYSINYKKLTDVLIEKVRTWSEVKLILEDDKYLHEDEDVKKILEDAKYYWIEIKSDKDMWTNYVHSKLILWKVFAFIQSWNFTYSAFHKSREFFLKIEQKDILENLNYIFDQDWEWKQIDKNKVHPNLLICPIDCREKIEFLLSNAEQSIKIQTQSLQDDNLIKILEQSDVEKQIILSDNSYNEDLIDVFWEDLKIQKEPYLHWKTILIDNKYLLIWSMNLTSNSLDNNREISIIVTDKDLIDKYLNNFHKDFKN